MTNTAIEKLPGYWRGMALTRLQCAEEAKHYDDQTNHTRKAAEYEAKAAELEGRAA